MDQDDIERAALRLLASREHSRAELRRKLASRADTELLDRVLEGLAQQQLQSDERYLTEYIHTRRRKGFGPIRIREELKQKGVAAGLIDGALDPGDASWRVLMIEASERKFGPLEGVDFKTRGKIARFLQYRGFTGEEISHYLRHGE